MVPDLGCANQIRIFAKGREPKLSLFERNQPATLLDDFADAVQEKMSAFHHAASEHDRIRCEHRDQVGQAETEIVSFPLYGALRQLVACTRQFADALRTQVGAEGIILGSFLLHPRTHCRTGSQRFPTAMKSAVA